MGFWFLFIYNLFIPMLMILIGKRFYNKPPKEINSIIGYRTTRSMKNQQTWVFANTYMGKLWWQVGLVLIILTVLVQLPFIHSDFDKLGILSCVIIVVQSLFMLLPIIFVEKALKENFNKDGTPR